MKQIALILTVFLFIGTASATRKFSKQLLVKHETQEKINNFRLQPPMMIQANKIVAIDQILQGYTYASLSSLAGLVGGALISQATGGDAYDDLVATVFGGLAGYVIGGAYGVYIYGQDHDGNGSFWVTLLGSAAGGLFYLIPAPIGAYFAYDWSNKELPAASASLDHLNKPLNIVIHF